jgi:serine/threonine protein kinase
MKSNLHPTGTIPCPDRAILAAYNTGNLSQHEIDLIARHLERCPRCLNDLQILDRRSGDPLLTSLRLPARREAFGPAEATHLLQRVETFCLSPLSLLGPQRPGADRPGTGPAPLGQIGPYELLEPLGEGGMGTVYKARHTHLGKIVALKLLPAQRMGNPAAVARFIQEIRAVGQLNHHHIVQAHDAAVEGIPYLAMEFIEGIDLARLVKKRGPLPLADACDCIRQAALALQHAHEAGLVHRDIKPSNLMLTPQGVVKLLDLGLARLHDEPAPGDGETAANARLATAGEFMGTIDYIAPEQLRNCHAVDIRADLYSLGCTLYHLLAGRPPFAGSEHNSTTKQQAHLQQDVPPIRHVRPNVPQALADVLERLLAKDPADRFPTPAALAAALEPFTAGCYLPRLVDTRLAPRPRQEPAPPPAAAPFTPVAPPSRPALLVGAAVLLATVLIGFWALRHLARSPGALSVSLEVQTPAGMIGRDVMSAQAQEVLTVSARLAQPAYCYLIAFGPDGQERLCWPTADAPPPAPTDELRCTVEGVVHVGESGLQVFVLVAAREPLADYANWKADGPQIPWQKCSAKGVWYFDGESFSQLSKANADDGEPSVPPSLDAVCRRVSQRQGVDAVRAIAFPVQQKGPPHAEPGFP